MHTYTHTHVWFNILIFLNIILGPYLEWEINIHLRLKDGETCGWVDRYMNADTELNKWMDRIIPWLMGRCNAQQMVAIEGWR